MLALTLSAAITAAVATAKLGDGCSAAEVRTAIAGADVRPLGIVSGDAVVLVELHASCMCGNVNCPYLVVRAGRPASVLLTAYAFQVGIERSGEALPRLRDHAHDSALVTDEDLYAYRAGRYEALAAYRVRGDTGARKPDTVPVRFAAGSSTARLHGSVALSWYDGYTFAATRGQQLTIEALTASAPPSFDLYDPQDGHLTELRPGVPVTLARSGTFALHVDGASERETPYAFTLAIR